jgi:hypothetical protein
MGFPLTELPIMRRLLPSLALLFLLASAYLPLAGAASWRTYSNRSLGFSVQYPASWRESAGLQVNAHQISLVFQGKQVYSVQILVVKVHPGKSLADTVARLAFYQAGLDNGAFGHIRWHATSLGRRPAEWGVSSLAAEGGGVNSQAFYAAPWKSRIYQISLAQYGKHALASVAQFAAVYGQILRTLRFL